MSRYILMNTATKKEIHTPTSIPHHVFTAGPPDGTDDRRDRSGALG